MAGQNTFLILLLNNGNMIAELKKKNENAVWVSFWENARK